MPETIQSCIILRVGTQMVGLPNSIHFGFHLNKGRYIDIVRKSRVRLSQDLGKYSTFPPLLPFSLCQNSTLITITHYSVNYKPSMAELCSKKWLKIKITKDKNKDKFCKCPTAIRSPTTTTTAATTSLTTKTIGSRNRQKLTNLHLTS